MKRILIHIVVASLFWSTAFCLFYRVENRLGLGNWYDRPELVAGRDVRYYQRIELSSCYLGTESEAKALLYRFLWLHWTEKTPALAEITYCGIDAGVTYYYFVEKDSWGNWSASLYSQQYQAFSTETYPLGHLGTAYNVERFSRNADGTIGGPIDSNADTNVEDFALRFFDRDHKSLAFPDKY